MADSFNIKITDEDIDYIEKLFGNVTFDESRRAVIKRLDSFDVQAYPGTGKTTILVAKLAILANKWPYSNKGICVLSHTNVAREEIETRLGKTEVGRKLLSYPHFIGTIHSFADTFMSMPWLRSKGYPIMMVDTKSTLLKRYNSLSSKSRIYISRKNLDMYCCEAIDYPVAINVRCSSESYTYKEVAKAIETSFEEGYFTFNEMLLIARNAISDDINLSIAIQNRFPLLLIDEAQDTSDLQWDIISLAFCKNDSTVAIERFGDANQAIFQSYSVEATNSNYPHEPIMTVNGSVRFGEGISKLADPLAVYQNGMIGISDFFSRIDSHTIFLFDPEKIEFVLPAFGKLVLSLFSDSELNTNHGIHAIGMVHNKEKSEVDDAHFPVGICDYFPNYKPDIFNPSRAPYYIIEYFRLSKRASTFDISVDWMAKGVRYYINSCTKKRIPFKKTALNSLCQELQPENRLSFRLDFWSLLSLQIDSKIDWEKTSKLLQSFCKKWFDVEVEEIQAFDWIDDMLIDENENTVNIYRYTNEEGRCINIQLGSIHSAKGRTHLATLVLDTYWYNRNISSILPWLTNADSKKMGKRDINRLKCHYVAFTRARGLICIAMPSNSITEDNVVALSKLGWKVTKI